MPLTSLGHGRYELLSVLGEGGMAAVWRARDTITGETIAVKLLHEDISERKSYRSRFLAEARTMRRLAHPSVLRVWDFGEDAGRPWFTMELVDDGALIDHLERSGKVPPLQALDIIFQVLQGLQIAHLATVVHRDVKPDNVLLNKDGTVKLSDFGIARIRNERVDHITNTGVAMGTAGYMSPEQRESAKDVGPRADLYAVGATMYATVTGCEPPDLFAAHLDPKLLDAVPPAIRDVVRKSCAYRPDKRYASARAMAEDVAKARDAIARGMGQPEVAREWMARFDRLIVDATQALAATAPPPPPPSTASTPPIEPSKPKYGRALPRPTPARAPQHPPLAGPPPVPKLPVVVHEDDLPAEKGATPAPLVPPAAPVAAVPTADRPPLAVLPVATPPPAQPATSPQASVSAQGLLVATVAAAAAVLVAAIAAYMLQ